MSTASSPTRRSWLRRLRGWLRPAPAAAPAFVPRRPYGTNSGQPYVGEIAIFAGNFAPVGWMFCDGSLLDPNEYSYLFALIGTTYGGNGQTTFALPDLRGRAPVNMGARPSGATRTIGTAAGTERHVLTLGQLPNHTHTVGVSSEPGNSASPQGTIPTDGGNGSAQYTTDTASLVGQPAQTLATVGSSQSHENMQPFLAVNYIISLFGIFPSP